MTTTLSNRTARDIIGQVVVIRGREYYVRTSQYAGLHMASVSLYRLPEFTEMNGKVNLETLTVRSATLMEVTKALGLDEKAAELTMGSLVRINNPKNTQEKTSLYVVTAVNEKSVSIVKLGGDHGRYLRASRTSLDLVDPAEVLR